MARKRLLLCLSVISVLAGTATADTLSRSNGSDDFVAGGAVVERLDAKQDAFIAGRAVTAKGTVAGDLHAAGFDVDIETETSGDLYAAGATVSIRAPVAQDLSLIGFTVRTAEDAVIGGNARLMGETVTIDGPVNGALSAAGREVVLNAAITGDTWITARTITFGPNAVISGKFAYSSEREILVPERVIPADRVTFEKLSVPQTLDDIGEVWDVTEYPVLPGFMSMFASFLITLAFLLILGALFLAFLFKPVENLRTSLVSRPGQTMLAGVVGLSALFGLVPVSAMTIVGILFVPIVILAIVLVWILGYALGAYSVAVHVWQAFAGGKELTNALRLGILALALIVVGALNYIPFVGWVANFTLVLLGIGAMTIALAERMIGKADKTTTGEIRS